MKGKTNDAVASEIIWMTLLGSGGEKLEAVCG